MNELNILSFTCKGLVDFKFVFDKMMSKDGPIFSVNGGHALADGQCNGHVQPKESTKNLYF